MKKSMLAAALAVVATPAGAVAVFNPANGHWYDYVSTPTNFAGALAGAEGATPIVGFDSYLATVTSAAENNFITAFVTGQTAWLAGSDAATEGVWMWVAGPELGQIFFGPGAPAGAYSNWNFGEPNNCCAGEDALHTNFGGPGGWNDISAASNYGYIVEYSPLRNGNVIPEPGTWAMMLLGFGAVGFAMRRSKAAAGALPQIA